MQRLVGGCTQPVRCLLSALFLFAILSGPGHAADAAAQPSERELIAQAIESEVADPLEPVNRAILDFNEFIQALLLRPLAEIYITIIPEFARDSIHNALRNVGAPAVLVHDLLQWEPARAWNTSRRFVINSTVGIGGLIDVADRVGIQHHREDLGQTLAVWGVPEGFYLVLPIFGPSNPRDAVGLFLGSYLDPMSQWADHTNREELTDTRSYLGGISDFSRVMDDLRKLKETSVDYYAALRSVSRQKRAADIANGTATEGAPLPDLKYDFNAEFAE